VVLTSEPETVVRRYLDHLVAHDWAALAECLHPDVVRVGPFGDTYSPRRPYVEFLSSLLPTLVNYDLTIERMVARQSVVVVQLREAMEVNGSRDVTREALVFDTDPAGLITRIDIFIQRPPG
jgi:ketosteroid isomerase-like protein